MQLIETKSLLAKLMATENLTVEQRKVPTAMFNVKTRVLTVPILDNNISSELYDLFMGHETGHALYTPALEMMDAIKADKISPSILNVVEDSRIERKIKYKYPGLKNSFVKAYRELYDRDFFGTEGLDLNELNLIDKINLHCKVGALMNIQFTDEERELLEAVESTETYAEVMKVAQRIADFMRKDANQKREEQIEKKKVLVKVTNGDGDDGAEEISQEELDEYDEIEYDFSEFDPTLGGGESDIEDEIKSFTDEAYKRNESQLHSDNPYEHIYANIPYVDPKKVVFDHKELWKKYRDESHSIDEKQFNKLRMESSKVVSYLIKEFELRKNADQMKRASIAKTGELNMSKIFSYRFSEDIFKKVSVVPGGKSHGLIMFIDWSGSMIEHIANTMKQLFNLVMFCKSVGIPYEVYAFAEDTVAQKLFSPPRFSGDIQYCAFGCLNLLSSRMSATEFKYAASALCYLSAMDGQSRYNRMPHWMQMTGTPLNDSIIAAMELVPEFKKANKLQIVNTVFLTDGDSNGMRGYYDDRGSSMGFRYGKYMTVLRDPKTKHQETVDMSAGYQMQVHMTTALIKLLKERVGGNVIGFYVISGREISRKLSHFYPGKSNAEYDKLKEDFRKEASMVVTNSGFTEYYLLRSNGLSTDDEEDYQITDNMTTRGMVSAFTKYTSNRVLSRVVLNRFIKLIA